ncbi:MAG: hypothetical protein ABIR96_01615 [Bdellovibrionota bacterium]
MPFILRLGLDINAVNRQALRKVYRAWALSPEFKELKERGPDVRFERVRDSGVFEDLFLSMLQKDFRVVDLPDAPIVRSFFEKEKNLSGRIEWQPHLDQEPRVFRYESRFTNNALLLGFWVALIFIFFGLSVHTGALLTILVMLLWQVRWNPLDIPFYLLDEGRLAVGEARAGTLSPELVIISAAVASFVLLFAFRPIFRKWIAKLGDRSVIYFMFLSLVIEPVFLFAASRILAWGSETFWWKVYLGSLCFRFVGVAFLMSLFFRGQPVDLSEDPDEDVPKLPVASRAWSRIDYIRVATREGKHLEWRAGIWSLLLPLVFVLAGGWEWLNAVMIVDAGWSILMLKAFLTGLLLAVLTGSRFVSMFIGLLALAQVASPTEGHWMAAAVFGFFSEGLWLGWWLSPMKDLHPTMPLNRYRKIFFVSALIGWALGIFVYTAGVPLVLCWILVLLGVWSYGQIQDVRSSHGASS